MEMTNEPQLRSFAQREAPFLKPLMNSLLRRLDRNPKSERDLERLASTHRKVGDLESALNAYAQICEFAPDNTQAQYWFHSLRGKKTPVRPNTDIRPGRFVCLDEFLTQDQYEKVLNLPQLVQDNFRISSVRSLDSGATHREQTVRNSWSAPLDCPCWFRRSIDAITQRTMACLGYGKSKFQAKGFRLTHYRNGDFFSIHRDARIGADQPVAAFIYYFEFPSYGFEGGELVIYDTSLPTESPSVYYTKLKPISNRIVFLHTFDFHEVLAVSCSSEWKAGRFSITGLVYET